MIDWSGMSLLTNCAVFIVAAILVWLSGTRLSYYADALSRQTGLGQAVIGVLLLGGITSLPEIAVAGSASLSGDALLATNNLLGGVAMQVVILAFADMAVRHTALTKAMPDPVVLLQGCIGIILLGIVGLGAAGADVPIGGTGLTTWIVFVLFVLSIWLIARSQKNPSWQILGEPPAPELDREEKTVERSVKRAAVGIAVSGCVIFVAGYVLSRTGSALADQTGLGSSFFGAVFVALATSLPEISTVLAAARLGNYVMAASDIFGTNLFDIAVIFPVDLLYTDGAVLAQSGIFSVTAALLGMVVTAIFMVGLLERRDPVVSGIGLDSIAVLVTYVVGIVLLFNLA